MRGALLTTTFLVLASPVWSDTFTLNSQVTSATVYPSGATLVRSTEFDVPAGSHRLLIGDIPANIDTSSLRIRSADGVTIGATAIRTDRLPPDDREIEARKVIEDQIDAQRDLIRERTSARTAIALEIDAAKVRLDFLDSLAEGQENGAERPTNESLSDLITLIGTESLRAMQDAHDARLRIEAIDREIADLKEELDRLEQELAAVALPLTDRLVLSIDITAETASSGQLSLEYVTGNARWSPVYDVRLASTETTLTISRQALLAQGTGESWEGVAVILSTARPNLQLAPFELSPQFAFLYDEIAVRREATTAGVAMMDMAMEAAPVVMEENAPAFAPVELSFQGLTAVYALPGVVTLDGDGTESLFTIDTTDFDATLTAQATPILDESVYLMAGFTNKASAPYLPGRASMYRDGAFVGTFGMPMIAAGQERELPFGVIEGLTATRETEFRETGESGLLTTSNDREERYLLTVSNTTNRNWDIRLLDRVPYSEEEDLEIDFTARPVPTETNIDGKRGVLAWDFTLPAGGEQNVSFGYTLGWPEDKELGFQ